MFDITVKIATPDDAVKVAAVFAKIAEVFGGSPQTTEPARGRSKKTTEPAATDTAPAKPDPVAAYVDAGGTLPPDTVSKPETIAELVDKVEADTTQPSVAGLTLAEKQDKVRVLGRPHGAVWLREKVLVPYKVGRIGDLPEAVVDKLLAELEQAPATEAVA